MNTQLKLAAAAITGASSLWLTGCGSGSSFNKSLTIDGSTTVYPIVQAMGEDFYATHRDVTVSINKAGTGSGFQKFARGELDIATASRPIQPAEDTELRAKGIDYLEIPIAYDGVTVIVNPQNNWVDKLTLQELRSAWHSLSNVNLWSDVRPGFPRERIVYHGPTDNHGTYEYFTEAINGKKDDIRSDCQKDQEYNSIIQAVANEKDAIAYVGFNYYDQNRDKVKGVPVDAGKGAVAPSKETIADGSYSPLSRPLFLYINRKSYDTKPVVKSFVAFAMSKSGDKDVEESSYVPIPTELHRSLERHIAIERTGTLFAHVTPGEKLSALYAKEGLP